MFTVLRHIHCQRLRPIAPGASPLRPYGTASFGGEQRDPGRTCHHLVSRNYRTNPFMLLCPGTVLMITSPHPSRACPGGESAKPRCIRTAVRFRVRIVGRSGGAGDGPTRPPAYSQGPAHTRTVCLRACVCVRTSVNASHRRTSRREDEEEIPIKTSSSTFPPMPPLLSSPSLVHPTKPFGASFNKACFLVPPPSSLFLLQNSR